MIDRTRLEILSEEAAMHILLDERKRSDVEDFLI